MFYLQVDPNVENKLDTFVQNAPENMVETAKELMKGDTSTVENVIEQCVKYGVEAGRSIIVALLIYFIGRFIINFIKKLFIGMMERRHMDPTIQSFLRNITSVLLNVLLIITVVSALGINTTSFAALLASFGVATGMALSGNLQNLAGGIIILLFKPYRVGDYIEAQGISGTVKEIQIFHTIILTVDNKQVHIPNGSLSSGSITNYSTCPERRLDLTVGVEYGEDIQKVRQAILDIVNKDERVIQEEGRKPFVRLAELADSSVNYTIRVWVKGADYWPVYFDTQETIYAEFNRLGIGFPFPHLTIDQKA